MDAVLPSGEARAAALKLMRDPATPTRDCLAVCAWLRSTGWPEDAVSDCLDILDAKLQRGGDRAGRRDSLRFRLQMAVETVKTSLGQSSNEAARDLLDRVAAEAAAFEAENSLGAGENALRPALGTLLWGLGQDAQDAGLGELAAGWLYRAAPLVSAPDCWLAAASCLFQIGQNEQSKECVQEALKIDSSHLGSILLSLMLSIKELNQSQMGQAQSPESCTTIIELLKGHPALSIQQATCATRALLELQREDMALAGLELLLSCILKHAARTEGQLEKLQVSDALCIARDLVQRAAAVSGNDGAFQKYLALAAQLLSLLRNSIKEDFGPVAGPAALEVMCIFHIAWTRAKAASQKGAWEECISLFEAAEQFLNALGDLALPEVSLARAWCLLLAASAWAERARALPAGQIARQELLESAKTDLTRAYQLSKQARMSSASGTASAAAAEARLMKQVRLFRLLVLTEFEVRCLASEQSSLLRFVEHISTVEDFDPKCLLAMAKIAAARSNRRLGAYCLERYLHLMAADGSRSNAAEFTTALRELVELQSSRNESFHLFESALHLLQRGGDELSTKDELKEELPWVVATAWNNGVYFHRLEQHRWSNRWLDCGLKLAAHCPPGNFPVEEMTVAHGECVSRCSD